MFPVNDDFLVFTYFFCNCRDLREEVCRIFSTEERRSRYSIEERDLDLKEVAQGYTNERSKAVLYTPLTNNNHTVLFSNLPDGWYTLVNLLCKKLSADAISVATTLDTHPNPIQSLYFYKNGENVRIARVMKDGDRWDFFERGERLEVENESVLKKRKIKDRLNRDEIFSCLKNLGVDPLDVSLWTSNEKALVICETR